MDDNVEDIEFDLDEEDGSDNNDVEVDVIDVIESDAGVDDDDDDDDDDDAFLEQADDELLGDAPRSYPPLARSPW